jgi:hypothetical protein
LFVWGRGIFVWKPLCLLGLWRIAFIAALTTV